MCHDKSSSVQQQRELHFTGRVQGVGFRYTVRTLATRFEVTGFVRNLPDGRVQLLAEGDADEIARFITAVNRELGRYITGVEALERSAEGRYPDFEIRF